ncbi:RE2 [Symbiodinium sp. CCMP2456]|nr:RE2 [Symbiodinium sp. CCMP2456]
MAERKVKEHKVDLPSIYRGFLLINALGLNDQEIKALLNYTHGSIEPGEVRTWLRKNEAKLQANQLGTDTLPQRGRTSTTASSHSTHLVESATGSSALDGGEVSEMEALLADLVEDTEGQAEDDLGTIEEDEAAEILAVMIKEKHEKKTFSQSAQIKKDRELSRGYGQRQNRGQGPIKPGFYRLSIQELKQRTRCRACGRVGHWKRECPDQAGNHEKAAHFLEVELEEGDDALFFHFLEQENLDSSAVPQVFEQEPDGYGPKDSCEPSRAYTAQEFEVLYGESSGVDEVCATIDTGCPRTAVGAAESSLQDRGPGEFEILTLNDTALQAQTEIELNPAADNRWAIFAWQVVIYKVIMIVRPALRLLQNLCRPSPIEAIRLAQGHWDELPTSSLTEIRDEAARVIKNRRKEKETISEEGLYSPSEGLYSPSMTYSPVSPGQRVQHVRPSEASTNNGYELIEQARPEGIKERLVDKNLQERILDRGIQMLYTGLPSCHCDKAANVEVVLKSNENYLKTFFRCYLPPGPKQCKFFAWTVQQPLLEDQYAPLRNPLQKTVNYQMLPRELLCEMVQDICEHKNGFVATGSNQHYKQERCRMCQKLMKRARRELRTISPTGSTTTEAAYPSDIDRPSAMGQDAGDEIPLCRRKRRLLQQGAKGMVLTNRAFRHLIFAVKEAYSSPVACPFTTVRGDPKDRNVLIKLLCVDSGGLFRGHLLEKCPTEHAPMNMVAKLLRAVVAQWFVTTVGQIYQYSLLENATAQNYLDKTILEVLSISDFGESVATGNLLDIYAEDLEDDGPEQANGEQRVQDPGGPMAAELDDGGGIGADPLLPEQADGERRVQVPGGPLDIEPDEKPLPGVRGRTVQQLVKRAHEGLGHPNVDRFVRILKSAKASQEVLAAARKLQCSTCERFAETRPQRRAAPPKEYGLNEVVGLDTLWLPCIDGRKKLALNILDWSSHFQMVVPIKTVSPEAVWVAFQQWTRIFGPPRQLYVDQGPEFKGTFKTRASRDGIHVEPSSLESPFQRGSTERHGKTFKLILSKAMNQYTCQDYDTRRSLVDTTIMMKNRLANRGGFSPVQRVLGYLPRIPGGLLSSDSKDLEASRPDTVGDRTIQDAMAMRKAAATAFFAADCDQALKNALAAGPRPQIEYVAGQMVYFYRIGHSKSGGRIPDLWCGPARVIMTDLPGTLWLSYQGGVVKASPERVRPASQEELLTISGWLEGLSQVKKDFEQNPKRGYVDLSNEPVPVFEESEDQTADNTEDVPAEPIEWEPGRRVRQKTSPESLADVRLPAVQDESATAEPNTALSSWEPVPEPRVRPLERNEEDNGTGEERPTKRTRVELLEIYYAKLETLMKVRQRKEIRLKDLNQHDLDCFLKAAEKEIQNNLSTNAYEILDLDESARIRREKGDRIMESRFVRTAKPLEESDVDKARFEGVLLGDGRGGPCKAKVRHVMKGFSENGAEELDAATPQVTRDGVVATTQIIVSKGWKLGFLDFTQAFHSGDPIERELYAEQPQEGIPGLKRGQLLRLRKTCYGLLDGPMAWFRHFKKVLTKELGYVQSVVDPCIYYLYRDGQTGWDSLQGIVSVATDDLLHGGDERHQQKMEVLNKKYKLGKFQYGEGRFTGKNFKPLPDGGVLIEQEHYMEEKVKVIPISRARRNQRYSYCTDAEIAELRSLVGALAWLAKETRPDLCGRTSLLQQSFPRPRVRDLLQANALAQEAIKYPAGIKISPIPLERLRVSVVTDAAWGNATSNESPEGSTGDYWVETPTQWVRYHKKARRSLFHPGMAPGGPDLHQLRPGRQTLIQEDDRYRTHEDEWNRPNRVKLLEAGSWTGRTIFYKSEKQLPHGDIHEGFLQLARTSSQGGHILIYHDADLQYEPWAAVSVASWKSYRLKRKVVNTLAAECQALVAGVSNVHWHRFLLMEAQNDPAKDRDWEISVQKLPFMAVTDSKSLYDTLSKQTCPFSQVDDKRTAIDISILKRDLEGSGIVGSMAEI